MAAENDNSYENGNDHRNEKDKEEKELKEREETGRSTPRTNLSRSDSRMSLYSASMDMDRKSRKRARERSSDEEKESISNRRRNDKSRIVRNESELTKDFQESARKKSK